MTFIDFFAGIGGFRIGMEKAGHTCVGFCERDKYARASYISMHLLTEEQRSFLATLDLKQRQKEILKDEYLNGEWCATDIRLVNSKTIPRAECWCYGAPCQDFSIGSKARAGLDGDRSSLVREIFRILRELDERDRPEWLIYENVKGMLSTNGGEIISRFFWKWTSSGTMQNGFFSTRAITAYPKTAKGCILSDILETDVPQKYFLSKEQTKRIVWIE